MPESYGISVSRYVVSLLAARNGETARSIDRSRSEFKVGHAANCNKYPARARGSRGLTVWEITCRIYIGTRFLSKATCIPPLARGRIYSAGQPCATSNKLLLYCRWLSADTRLPISTSRSSLCNGKPELEARFLHGEPIKRPSRTSHRAPRNRDPVLSREEQYCRTYLAVRLTVTRSYYSKANLSAESIVRTRAFIRSLIYLIHSWFYLIPRTCVNSCALWNNERRDWPTYGSISDKHVYGFNPENAFFIILIFYVLLSNYSLTFTDINM